jgi:hypothetical protein
VELNLEIRLGSSKTLLLHGIVRECSMEERESINIYTRKKTEYYLKS